MNVTPPYRTRIKLCGMTCLDDVREAIQLGVDALGFIFYEQSPRAVRLAQAERLVPALSPFVDVVAVLVNPNVAFVEAILESLPIHYLQFHGQESASFCEQFKRPYIKAIAAHSRDYIASQMTLYPSASAFLIDTASAAHGGTGKTFDWQIVPPALKPIILAGGLNPSNVSGAIQQCAPYAIDVCSGVEQTPGKKDATKMKALIEEVRKNDRAIITG